MLPYGEFLPLERSYVIRGILQVARLRTDLLISDLISNDPSPEPESIEILVCQQMSRDVEEAELRQRLRKPEHRSENGNVPHGDKRFLTKALNTAYRITVIGASLYGLFYFDVLTQILKSPNVSHGWFKIGLASSVGKWKKETPHPTKDII